MEQENPDRRRIVVDGSNIATEGRTLPSLAQLDEAIRSFLEEYRGFATSDVTVVVDASFGHRIDPSEVSAFEQAVEHGEMITPPAGAVGRGDGFILRIAEKSGALVLSNDSFQEFHAERPWLFEPGRLIGGKPVPGVGWIFTPRTPVRGARSRSVTSKSRRDAKATESELPESEVDSDSPPPTEGAGRRRGGRGSRGGRSAAKVAAPAEDTAGAPLADHDDPDDSYDDNAPGRVAGGATKATKATKAAKATKVTKAAKATKATKATKAAKAATAAEPTDPDSPKMTKAATAKKAVKTTKTTKASKAATATKATKAMKATKSAKAAKATTAPAEAERPSPSPSPGRGPGGGTHEALNDPLTFLTFVADHPVGSTFDGTVVSFTSHGAHVKVGSMLCHIPLRNMAVPAPNKARQVLTKGETRPFVLVSLEPARRRAELALPGINT